MNVGDTDRFDIFLSHASAEGALAEAVEHQLGRVDLTVRLSACDAPAEEYTDAHVRTVLDAGRALVAIASRPSVKAPALFLEVGAASAAKLPVLLLLNDLPRENLPVFFRQFQAFPLWKGFPAFTKAIQKLPERLPA